MVLKSNKYAFIFLSPALFLISFFLYKPLISTFYYSFTNWTQFSAVKKYVGFSNYIRLFHDSVFPTALLNTLFLLIAGILVEVIFALILALLLDSINTGYKFLRTIYFFPVIISGSAIGLMFYLVYQYEYGLLNTIIGLLGIEKQNWVTEKTATLLVIIPTVWQQVGFYFVIFLTSMSKIPTEIYESALLDGITGIKKAYYITVPLIWEVVVTSIILVISNTMRVFDTFYVITNGGPADSSQLLSTYMYQQSIISNNQGYGCTIAVMIVLIGIILTVGANKLGKKEVLGY
jgi:raffinose/stachyose/melibiose transport system permease protein